MSKRFKIWISVFIAIAMAAMISYWPDKQATSPEKLLEKFEEDPVKTKIDREEYFFRILRDPATNRIPDNIRSRELSYSKTLPSRKNKRFKTITQATAELSWQSAGPNNLGGRTRALGIDQRDADIIIAGGVSGGVWKSTDGGNSWQMKTDPNQNMSVTSIAQDPSNPDTWYYSSGEYSGNSASASGASYYGTGIYKSTDNGESWSIILSTEDKDASFSSRFDFISRIKVSPTTGSIFAASNAFGLLRSTDDGSTFPLNKGGINQHVWTDFDIDSNGNIIAIFSSQSFTSGGDSGIFYSTDDGDNWTNVTPADFPDAHGRSVIAFAPSDPDIFYVFSRKTESNANQGVSFFEVDVSDPQNPAANDRSANLPDFGEPVGGVNLQGGYNMMVSVKPDDPNFVTIGATNLFRSRDGFVSAPADTNNDGLSDDYTKDEYWIGGYAKANNVSQYNNQHPDQHVMAYDPDNPDRVLAGHDGGLSVTSDITASSVSWEDRDNGYVTGQFYTVEISQSAGDNRIVGGTQDNGSPYFTVDDQNTQNADAEDISSGDGAYAHIGQNYVYTSSQNGRVLRWDSSLNSFAYVAPANASNELFIHPYAVDPSADSVMYYPGGREMWRNVNVDDISNTSNGGGTTQGWSSFTAVPDTGYTITALEVTTSQPSNRLYYAASGGDIPPKIFALDNARTSDNQQEVSISGVTDGAHIRDLAINPNDGDEVIAVMSNYNIVGLYHTTNGGNSWTAIEGNLQGDSENSGPSLRCATILPTSSGTMYFIGTSTGVYSASSLSGGNTSWTRESDGGGLGTIGYSVSEYITSRPSDGTIAVGTHGRGVFLGSLETTGIDSNDTTPPASPSALSMGSTIENVELSWDLNSENDVAKYRIYRGRQPNSLALYDSTSSGATDNYQDSNTSFNTFYYRITAVDVNGNESDYSNMTAAFRKDFAVNNEWKLVGMPLTSAEDVTLPDNLNLFSYNGAYQQTQSLYIQNGFWVKSTSDNKEIAFNGEAYTDVTITLEAGWNLIGGIADTIPTSSISDPDNILSQTPIFEYNGSFYSSDVTEIKPTTGYWIHANQGGGIGLSVTDSSSSSEKFLLAENELVNKIEFSQDGVIQAFYVTDEPVEENKRDMYRMPPKAPKTGLDVRTNNGFRLAEGQSTELQLTTSSYPVDVRLAGNANTVYLLKGITNQDTVFHKISSEKGAVLQRAHDEIYIENNAGSLVTKHELLPNYPNPFNPTTNIKYKIASESLVSLSVYDVLGRRVRTLVNEVQEPGIYTKTFDAQNLSSGTYFIRIKADDFSSVQQMTLIK